MAVAVALADKLDTLVGFWAIGEKPTGSGDPYQLRRAALGVIRIVLENDLRLPLQAIIARHRLRFLRTFEALSSVLGQRAMGEMASSEQAKSPDHRRRRQGRLRRSSYARERDARNFSQAAVELLVLLRRPAQGAPAREGRAARPDRCGVSLGGQDDLALIVKRVEALGEFLKTDDGAVLLAGVKRATNILRDEEKKDKKSYAGADDLDSAEPQGGAALAAAIEKVKQDTRRRHQRGELRRRHAGAGRAARAGRCLLRQGDRQRADAARCAPTASRCSPRSAPPPSTSPTSPRSRADLCAITTARPRTPSVRRPSRSATATPIVRPPPVCSAGPAE